MLFFHSVHWKKDTIKYGWYENWRGKLKYGMHNSTEIEGFDLYSDTEGGYLAYYDSSGDRVVPWDER